MASGPGPPGPPKSQTITATITFEAGTESPERTRGYIVQSLKSSLRNIRDGAAVICLYDDDDNLIGMDMSGTPSVTFQKAVDELLDKFDNPAGNNH